MKSIKYKTDIITIGSRVLIDEENQGSVSGFLKTGYWEEDRIYDVLISWDDDPENPIRTPIKNCLEWMILRIQKII